MPSLAVSGNAMAVLRNAAKDMNRMGLGVRNRVAMAVAQEMDALLGEQFDQGIGPDGEPWAPLAASTRRRGRTPPPLTDTGDLRRSVKARRQGTNVAIDSDLPAAFHQRGNPNLPRRPIWPEGELPERWSLALGLVANRALADAARAALPSFDTAAE